MSAVELPNPHFSGLRSFVQSWERWLISHYAASFSTDAMKLLFFTWQMFQEAPFFSSTSPNLYSWYAISMELNYANPLSIPIIMRTVHFSKELLLHELTRVWILPKHYRLGFFKFDLSIIYILIIFTYKFLLLDYCTPHTVRLYFEWTF